MTTERGKSQSKPSPKATTSQPGQEQSVGPLTQLLIRARQRIKDPAHWARGAYARDAHGAAVNVQDPTATCWCAVGTLEKECGNNTPSWIEMDKGAKKPKSNPLYHAAHHLLEQAAGPIMGQGKPTGSITAVNDGSGHAKVLLMYNKAIVLAKGK